MGKESKTPIYEITTVFGKPIWRRRLRTGSRLGLDYRDTSVEEPVIVDGFDYNKIFYLPAQVVFISNEKGIQSVWYTKATEEGHETVVLTGRAAIKAADIHGKTRGGRSVRIR